MPDPRDFFRTLLSGPEATTPPPRPRTAAPPPAEPPSWFDTVVEGGMRGLGAGVYYLGDLMRGATLGGDEGRTVSGVGELIASALPLVGGAKALKTAAGAIKMGRGAATAEEAAQAARMLRAAEQGFDTKRVLYHGTQSDFPAFAHGRRGTYLTDRPEIADIYAMTDRGGMTPNAGPNVMPVYIKGKKPLVISDLGPDGGNGWASDNLAAALGVENPGTGTKLYDEARKRGYDYVEIRDMSDLGGRQTQILPLDARSIRSVFAKFDPRNADSANLLASLVGGAGLASLAQFAQPRRPEAR